MRRSDLPPKCIARDGCGSPVAFADNYCVSCFFSNLKERVYSLDDRETIFRANRVGKRRQYRQYKKLVCRIRVVRQTCKCTGKKNTYTASKLKRLIVRAERIMSKCSITTDPGYDIVIDDDECEEEPGEMSSSEPEASFTDSGEGESSE